MDIKVSFHTIVGGINIPLTAYAHTEIAENCSLQAIVDHVVDCSGKRLEPDYLPSRVREDADRAVFAEAKKFIDAAWNSGEQVRS